MSFYTATWVFLLTFEVLAEATLIKRALRSTLLSTQSPTMDFGSNFVYVPAHPEEEDIYQVSD